MSFFSDAFKTICLLSEDLRKAKDKFFPFKAIYIRYKIWRFKKKALKYPIPLDDAYKMYRDYADFCLKFNINAKLKTRDNTVHPGYEVVNIYERNDRVLRTEEPYIWYIKFTRTKLRQNIIPGIQYEYINKGTEYDIFQIKIEGLKDNSFLNYKVSFNDVDVDTIDRSSNTTFNEKEIDYEVLHLLVESFIDNITTYGKRYIYNEE